jgi:hypothetical protein
MFSDVVMELPNSSLSFLSKRRETPGVKFDAGLPPTT